MILVVLDVNVLISAIISRAGHPHQLLVAWLAGRFELATSDHIVNEVVAKLRLPRIARRYNLKGRDATWVIALLRWRATLVHVPPQEILAVTGDPEDDAVLAVVRLCGAAYLVTGDKGLLPLGTYGDATIVTPRAFLDILGSTPATP